MTFDYLKYGGPWDSWDREAIYEQAYMNLETPRISISWQCNNHIRDGKWECSLLGPFKYVMPIECKIGASGWRDDGRCKSRRLLIDHRDFLHRIFDRAKSLIQHYGLCGPIAYQQDGSLQRSWSWSNVPDILPFPALNDPRCPPFAKELFISITRFPVSTELPPDDPPDEPQPPNNSSRPDRNTVAATHILKMRTPASWLHEDKSWYRYAAQLDQDFLTCLPNSLA